ncbi:hypothetical protein CIHG_09898 [Coccidioides immitis H538.4]|uniref:Uncharacterized protein n=1 Tax=Coccidioides immitis H538.4 TaxID=396776 RepID=A0A0J8S3M5_COCIT|nr:hypothetical protein CIHG_09898 [Coccidioides immitis H538.4]
MEGLLDWNCSGNGLLSSPAMVNHSSKARSSSTASKQVQADWRTEYTRRKAILRAPISQATVQSRQFNHPRWLRIPNAHDVVILDWTSKKDTIIIIVPAKYLVTPPSRARLPSRLPLMNPQFPPLNAACYPVGQTRCQFPVPDPDTQSMPNLPSPKNPPETRHVEMGEANNNNEKK